VLVEPSVEPAPPVPPLTRRERDVLDALCRPLTASGQAFPEPLSVRELAVELGSAARRPRRHDLLQEGRPDVRHRATVPWKIPCGSHTGSGSTSAEECRRRSTVDARDRLAEAEVGRRHNPETIRAGKNAKTRSCWVMGCGALSQSLGDGRRDAYARPSLR
jgi:hypothetical protein